MRLTWVIPAYYSFIVDEIEAMTDLVQSLQVISYAEPPTDRALRATHHRLRPTPHLLPAIGRLTKAIPKVVRSLPCPKTRKSLRLTAKAALESAEIVGETRRHNSALIHSHFLEPRGTAGLLWEVPTVLTVRGVDVLTDPEIGYGYSLNPDYRQLASLSLRKAAAVTAHTTGLAAGAEKIAPGIGVDVLPNGVDTIRFAPKSPKVDLSCYLADNRLTMTGIACGALIRRKGFDTLITALAQPALKNVGCVIVGEGNERQALEKLSVKLGVEQKVALIGQVDQSEFATLLRSADFFVSSSTVDGIPNVLLEALSSGVPTITTDTGAARDVIEDGVNGFIIQPRDTAELVRRIGRLVSSPELRRDMAAEARRSQLSTGNTHQWKAEQYLEIYDRVLRS